MMDIDGNGRVSYDELLQTAKQSLEATKKMGEAADQMPDDLLQVWVGLIVT
jgi:Ca2+-binding EF-hand superfamily protein